MTETVLKFLYNGLEVKMNGKKDEYMKDIFSKYAQKINKNNKNFYFLYNGNKIDEESKLQEINNKDNEITILVYELNQNINSENIIVDSEENKTLKEEIQFLKNQNKILLENQKLLMEQILKLNEKVNNRICPRCKGQGMVPKTLDWDSSYGLYYYPSGHYYSTLKHYSGYGEYCGRSNAFSFILDSCPLCKGEGFVNLERYIRCEVCNELCGYQNGNSSQGKRGFCNSCNGLGYKENDKIKKE